MSLQVKIKTDKKINQDKRRKRRLFKIFRQLE